MKACEMSQDVNIQTLKQITDEYYHTARHFSETFLKKPHVIDYEAQDGSKITAHGLINIPDVLAVMVLYMQKGQIFVPHSHPGREWGKIVKGELELKTNGDFTVVGPGEFICYDPHHSHGGKALKDTTIIFISEDGEGYPVGQYTL